MLVAPPPPKTNSRNLSPKIKILLLLIAGGIYVILGSFLIYNHHLSKLSGVESLAFGYGPLVNSLIHTGLYESCIQGVMATEVCFSAHRLPFVPYFLVASYYLFSNNLFLITLFKNIIFLTLLIAPLYYVYSYSNLKKATLLLFLFVLTFPRWILHFFQINTEEPYIIPFLAFFFAYLIFKSDQKLYFIFFIISCCGLLFSKNSLLYVILFAPFLVWIQYKHYTKTAITVIATIAGIICLAYFNYTVSGKFTTGSSWEGWNLYKGNNPYVLTMYPNESLDLLDERKLIPVHGMSFKSEWEYSDHLKSIAVNFIKDNPIHFLKLTLLKTWLFFIVPYSPPCCTPGGILTVINNIYLIIFRILFWGCISFSIYSLYKGRNRSFIFKPFICFTIPVLLFGGFYIIGFVYERHITPIILPTIFYFIKLGNIYTISRKNPTLTKGIKLTSLNSLPRTKNKIDQLKY
jgi:hypothetical protein